MHVTMLRLSFAYAIFTAPLVPAHLFDNTSDNRLKMTPFRVGIENTIFDTNTPFCTQVTCVLCLPFLFSQWYFSRGIAGCMQSTSSSTWSLQANSEKFIEYFLKMSLLHLHLFVEKAAFWKHLIHQVLQLNCDIFSGKKKVFVDSFSQLATG